MQLCFTAEVIMYHYILWAVMKKALNPVKGMFMNVIVIGFHQQSLMRQCNVPWKNPEVLSQFEFIIQSSGKAVQG